MHRPRSSQLNIRINKFKMSPVPSDLSVVGRSLKRPRALPCTRQGASISTCILQMSFKVLRVTALRRSLAAGSCMRSGPNYSLQASDHPAERYGGHPLLKQRKRGFVPAIVLLAITCLHRNASAQQLDSNKDNFEFYGRAATNVQMFQRALLPGPGGAIVNQQLMAPIHQSLSARAVGVDSPMGKDSLEIQVAAYGQVVPGADDAVQTATFDVASAFIRQSWHGASLSLGRQTVAGGAARYARFDGGKLAIRTDFGLELTGYGGLTALPRWDQRSGYHNLGANYELWSREGDPSRSLDRVDQWMAGMRAQLSSSKVGSVGFSYHQQAEDAALFSSTLGLDGSLTVIDRVELTGDALFNTDSQRFSDVRLAAHIQAWKHAAGALMIRAEFLHTVPSLLLSQSSVFSVFAFQEVTEAGGEASLGLPAGFSVETSAYGQMYQEGQAGVRAQGGVSYVSDADRTFFARVMFGRFHNLDNGYVMLRSSLSYRLTEQLTALADLYHYRYDSPISELRSSSFYAAHLAYAASANWSGRIGTSLARSPYAAFDLQALARIEYQFDVRAP